MASEATLSPEMSPCVTLDSIPGDVRLMVLISAFLRLFGLFFSARGQAAECPEKLYRYREKYGAVFLGSYLA